MNLWTYEPSDLWAVTRKDDKEASQTLEKRPGQILEGHDVAEDSTRQANLEMAWWGPSTEHYGCPMMMTTKREICIKYYLNAIEN